MAWHGKHIRLCSVFNLVLTSLIVYFTVLSASINADTDTLPMWQLCSLEIVHLIHKSSGHKTATQSQTYSSQFLTHRKTWFSQVYIHLGVLVFPQQSECQPVDYEAYSHSPDYITTYLWWWRELKSYFFPLLCRVCLIDYWFSPYVSFILDLATCWLSTAEPFEHTSSIWHTEKNMF